VLLPLALGLVAAGCAMPPGDARVAGQTPTIPECAQAGRFAFAGQASLAELGLGGLGGFGGAEAARPARIWVTADPVSLIGPVAPPGIDEPPPRRVFCAEWADGSAVMGEVPDGWEPPAAIPLDAADGQAAGPSPLLLLLLAALAIGGVSLLAFRGADR
jgi:hypothetical protein